MMTNKMCNRVLISLCAIYGVFVCNTVLAYDSPKICGGPSSDNCHSLTRDMTWVLVGDSITSPHLYSDYLEAYYHLRYPDLHLHFRNEGRSGGNFAELFTDDNTRDHCRYERRVESWEPNFVSVMLGDNEGYVDSSIFRDRVQTFINDYVVSKNNATTVLFGPTPTYSANGDICGEPKLKLRDYANEIVDMGEFYNYPYANVWGDVNEIFYSNFKSQNPVDIGMSLQDGNDCVHPNAAGHLVIVYEILKQLGADGEVSAVEIDASTMEHSEVDAEVTNLSGGTTELEFDRLDARLPMAWDPNAIEGTKLIPEIWNTNKYMLTVHNLNSGFYDVYIDGVLSATVLSTELDDGWNMSKMTKGPIFEQLQETLGRIRDKEGKDRETLESLQPWSGVRKYQSNADYYYHDLGLRDAQLREKLSDVIADVNRLDEAIYLAAEPKKHHFKLVKRETVVSEASADVDNNSTINTTDAMLTLRHSLGLSMNGTNWNSNSTTGDVNCDGTSNSTDAMLILRYSVGLSMSGTSWCVE